jgi:uncharacterized membrane protein
MRWFVGTTLTALALFVPAVAPAQEVFQELQETVRAEVVEIVREEEVEIFGTGALRTVQEVRAEIHSGLRTGEVVTFENDLILLAVGDDIFLNRLERIDGTEYFLFKDANRTMPLITLALLFAGLLVWFAGKQGVRALGSLIVSVIAIMYLLVPALLAGYSPALASVGIAGLILFVVLFGTHGFRPHTAIAFGGTFAAVVATWSIAAVWVGAMKLSGFSSDASVYLNFSTGGTLDFAGLLLGSIIIGVLGVLDDVAITQASVVQELKAANPKFAFGDLYQRSIRVGRDHVGSLVNTLALAYVGAALPLVLLFARTDNTLFEIINQEIVAAEYTRILVGSVGLILAVPFTTLIAAWWFATRTVDEHTAALHTHHHHH